MAFIHGVGDARVSRSCRRRDAACDGVAVFAGMIGVTAFAFSSRPCSTWRCGKLTGNRALKRHGEIPHIEAFARRGGRIGGKPLLRRALQRDDEAMTQPNLFPFALTLVLRRVRQRASDRSGFSALRRRPVSAKPMRPVAALVPTEAQSRGTWGRPQRSGARSTRGAGYAQHTSIQVASARLQQARALVRSARSRTAAGRCRGRRRAPARPDHIRRADHVAHVGATCRMRWTCRAGWQAPPTRATR